MELRIDSTFLYIICCTFVQIILTIHIYFPSYWCIMGIGRGPWKRLNIFNSSKNVISINSEN